MFLAKATPTDLIGSYDGVRLGRVHGWAFDPAHPTERIVVEAVSLSGARVPAVADRYRADVHKSGWGDGYSGFAIPVDRLGDAEGLRIFCCHPSAELPGPATGPKAGRPLRAQRQSYMLHLDDRRPGAPLTGWAVDWDCPDRRRLLQFQGEAGNVVRQRATLFRADMRSSRSDGYLGFSLPAPSGRGATITDLANGVSIRVSS
jgi:hypothetical protein